MHEVYVYDLVSKSEKSDVLHGLLRNCSGAKEMRARLQRMADCRFADPVKARAFADGLYEEAMAIRKANQSAVNDPNVDLNASSAVDEVVSYGGTRMSGINRILGRRVA
ncbi:hypothetical protein LIN78_12010 [Leeia sp. TBRC 13508]|uniref:Uncharacterized protein n=1 Tax=Leeia speluncae TaxID=2884804 RepID=A0ABS8D7T3_9NEIS|nr:hypothetical protein [Leeia speluncae]MCB6184269.1 hypothetical protein [Leeia speluncae]